MLSFKEYIKEQSENIIFDVIFEDSVKRIAAFVATHTVSDEDMQVAFRKLGIKDYTSFDENKVIKSHLKKTPLVNPQNRNNHKGKILSGWPIFYDYFEKNITSGQVTIDHLFLDYDMPDVVDLQSKHHPLAPETGFGIFETHAAIIKDYRLQNNLAKNDLKYYFPSGQGVTEYLVDNADRFISKIKTICVHCSREANAKRMIDDLQAVGYNAIRYSSKVGNETGFIL